MRVLYFTRDYTPHDHRFLAALAQTDHQVFFLRLERTGRQLEDRPVPAGIEQIQWRGGQRPLRRRDVPGLVLGLRRVIGRIQPDVVHAGPVHNAAWIAALAGVHPLVSMSWGSDLLLDVDHSRELYLRARYTLDRTDILLVDCLAVMQKAAKLGFPSERKVIFPWGVDLDTFRPPAEPSALRERKGWQDCFTVLCLRSWEPLYGVDVVARAFVRAVQERPQLRLFLLGNGSQAKLIHEILQHGGAHDLVHFGGQVIQSELPDYYQAADLYLSASHSDGSSVSLLEALACGRPVLLSDIPSNQEWILPGREGWFFRDGDEADLAAGLIRAVDAAAGLPEMGRAARQVAEVRADWKQNFARLLTAYEWAVNPRLRDVR